MSTSTVKRAEQQGQVTSICFAVMAVRGSAPRGLADGNGVPTYGTWIGDCTSKGSHDSTPLLPPGGSLGDPVEKPMPSIRTVLRAERVLGVVLWLGLLIVLLRFAIH